MSATQIAIYARVSSDQQTEAQTVASQVAALRERVAAEGLALPDAMQFIDEGYSGATLIRPALERLRDVIAARAVDRLYIHSPDRLARKYAYQVLLVDEFRRAGVEVIFLNRALGQSPEDDLLLQVQGMIAEYERAKIIERHRRGKRHAAQAGVVNVLSGGLCRNFHLRGFGVCSPAVTQATERGRATMAVSFKGAHFPQDIILIGVRWYVAYPLSTRHVEELMLERGVHVDHSTINRWVIKYSPQLEEAFHQRKRPVWVSWRMDETYIKVKGQWYYLYRAVDKHGQTIDFLLTEHRDEEAALKFLKKAIRRHGVPETITIDGSAANEAAIKRYNEEHGTAIAIRKRKYLNNIVEQDHRAVKRVTRPMLGFKSFEAAQDTLVGIELMHMIKKRQLVVEERDEGRTAAELFYSLAA